MIKFQQSILFLAIIVMALVVNACDGKEPAEHPNIVWLTSEDNGVHYMKMYDEGGVATPNIEALADQGLTFTHAFSNAAVCSAARSTIISGCYGPRLASHYHRRQQKVPMPADLNMYPYYLKQAGYYTANNYKEDYNIFMSDSVWNDSSKKAHWRNRAEGQPFFYIQNFGVTHESRVHFPTEDVENVKTNYPMEEVKVQPNHPNTPLFKYTNARYRDKISQMDAQVGQVIKDLDADGLLENTFIFYYGDHGGVLPGSKGYLYETGVHVPMVVYVPEKYKHLVAFEKGSKVDGFVSFVDLAPTVLRLAGIELPDEMDGKAFLGKGIKASEVNNRNTTYSYADRFDEKYDMVRAIRKGKYKYIRSYQPFNYDGLMNNYRYKQQAYIEWKDLYEQGKLNKVQSAFFEAKDPEMLFNVEEDNYETVNLSHLDKYADVLKEMRILYNQKEENLCDLSFYPEFYLKDVAFDNPVQFGVKHKNDLIRYKTIADLQILPFADAKDGIEKALKSGDVWDRYWALIVCSSFGQEAKIFAANIQKIAAEDDERINRVRAAEFLGITKLAHPDTVMLDALYSTTDETEALLILNSMVLMSDIHYDYKFEINRKNIANNILQGNETQLSLDYVMNLSQTER
jgi:arylsulfatase A-like enzyme